MNLCDNMQSSGGNYSMRHRVSRVFFLYLSFISIESGAAACISGGTTFTGSKLKKKV